jgi:hypothetical protein
MSCAESTIEAARRSKTWEVRPANVRATLLRSAGAVKLVEEDLGECLADGESFLPRSLAD